MDRCIRLGSVGYRGGRVEFVGRFTESFSCSRRSPFVLVGIYYLPLTSPEFSDEC